MQEPMEKQNEVIFIGAGPVGLWLAIQMQLNDPALKIKLFEKYKEYKRSHVLILDKETTFKDVHSNPAFKKMIADFPSHIRTNDLEKSLKEFALKLGIIIDYQEVKNCEALAKDHPNANVFIGTDGSHSIVREQIFENALQTNKNLQYVVEAKYDAVIKGKETKISVLNKAVFESQTQHLVFEYVGREKDGKVPVSIRTFVDEKTYLALKGENGDKASFKKPLQLTDLNSKELADLHTTLSKWLAAREGLLNEKCVKETFKITSIPLNAYNAEQIVANKFNKKWILAGDAALGVPFFRALNDGFIIGNLAAPLIVNYLLSGNEEYLDKLNNEALKIMNNEITRAQIKSGFLTLGRAARQKMSFMFGSISESASTPANVILPTLRMKKELHRDHVPQNPEEILFINMKEELECICEYVTKKPINVIGQGLNDMFSGALFSNFNVIKKLQEAANTSADAVELLTKVISLEPKVIEYGDFKRLLADFVNKGSEQLREFYKKVFTKSQDDKEAVVEEIKNESLSL